MAQEQKKGVVCSATIWATQCGQQAVCLGLMLSTEERLISPDTGNSSSLKIGGAEMENKILARGPFSTNKQNYASIL